MRTNRPKSRAGFTLLRLLVVIAILGLLMGLFLPAIKRAAHRSHYLNSLKQQVLAVTNYLSAFANLSSAFRSPTGTRLPWQTPTSPYLDHPGLYDGYGQPPTGARLPWQTPTSPYLDHPGSYDVYGQPPTGMRLPWQTPTSPYLEH